MVEYSSFLFFKHRYVFYVFLCYFFKGRDFLSTPFLLVHTLSDFFPYTNSLSQGKKTERLCWGAHSFHHRFSVKICGPVDEVEGSKEDGKHYPRHLINLADAVVGLLRVHQLGLSGTELYRCCVEDGGDGHVLGEVGGVVDACRANVVGLFRQHHGVTFLQRDRLQEWISFTLCSAGFGLR